MAKRKILVIEDDDDIVELLTYHLVREGFLVFTATSGENGLEAAKRNPPQLILLDLMLPGIDGLEVCRLLRANDRTAAIPIVMLTAKGEEADVVAGLEVGADDYVTKPFSPAVLVARVRNILRRKSIRLADDETPLKVQDLVIHPGRHEVLLKNKRLDLTITEFRLLHLLARRPGWVYTRKQIVDAVRGEDYAVTERAVDVQLVGLRRKLGNAGHYIETVRGVGYRFFE